MFNQLNKRIKEFIWSKFRGIDRSRSANDADPNSAQILRDLVITPEGNLKRRDEFAALYEDRPSQFEHTTNDDIVTAAISRRTVITPSNTHLITRTHGAKSIAVGKNLQIEYVFVGYVEREITANDTSLFLIRGARSGSDITWNDHATGVPPPEKKKIFSVGQTTGGDMDETNDWIEFSMVMNAAKTAIYIAAVSSQDAGAPVVALYKVTDIYNADFETATVAASIANVETSADIGRHIDIEIGTADNMMLCWWKTVGGHYVIRYCYGLEGGGMGAAASFDRGKDIFGFSLVRDPSQTSTNRFYLSYYEDETGFYNIDYQLFVDGVETGTQYNVAIGAYAESVVYQIAVVSAIDIDGTKHWLYRTGAQTLTHTYEDVTP